MAAPEPDVYESDPDRRPDSDFEPGSLVQLAVGNRGRLLDPRRTPVTVVEVTPERGSFTVRVDAFEDTGAHWELFLAEVERFQFKLGSRRLADGDLATMSAARSRFERPLRIAADPERREASLREVLRRRRELAPRVAEIGLSDERIDRAIDERLGSRRAFGLVGEILGERGLAALERDLLDPLISNPRSGEMVKGHAIVLAELGLCRFDGQVVRDPHLFDGRGSKEARMEHVLWRMALTQEIWAHTSQRAVYRVVSSDAGIRPATASLVSATLSEEVAKSHLAAGASRRQTTLMTRGLPLKRTFMTFLETEAMNAPFREAEAVVVADSDGAL